MIQIFLSILILVLTFYFNKLYLTPYKIIKSYQKSFTEKGYKNFVNGNISTNKIDQKLGDSFKTIKQKCSQYDVILGSLKGKTWILLNHPNLIRQFCLAQKDYKLLKPQRSKEIFQKMAHGILFSEKQQWKKKKRILSNVFNYQFLSRLTPKIDKIFCQSLVQTEKQAKSDTKKQFTYDFLNFSQTATSETILDCFLGLKDKNLSINGEKASRFLIELIQDFINYILDPLVVIFGIKFVELGLRQKDRDITKRLNMLDKWSSEYIKNRIQQFNKKNNNCQQIGQPQDIIEAILIQNMKLKQQQRYTQIQIVDQFKLFFLAGTDTTSHYIVMLLYYIAKYPQVNQKVRNEVTEFLLKNKQITSQNLKSLNYIQAVMKQTTRIYGPANFSFLRYAVQDMYISQVPIRKDTYIRHFTMSIHHSQKYYKNPFEFRPQRWINGECDNLDPFALIGFSSGSRSCIGKQLAQIEAKIAIIRFIQRYKNVNVPQEPLRMQFKFVYAPKNFESTMTLADEVAFEQ